MSEPIGPCDGPGCDARLNVDDFHLSLGACDHSPGGRCDVTYFCSWPCLAEYASRRAWVPS